MSEDRRKQAIPAFAKTGTWIRGKLNNQVIYEWFVPQRLPTIFSFFVVGDGGDRPCSHRDTKQLKRPAKRRAQ